MSKAKRNRATKPQSKAPSDYRPITTLDTHIRTLYGVRNVLMLLSDQVWHGQPGHPLYLGLEALAQALGTATEALDEALGEDERMQPAPDVSDDKGGAHA
jgi:hypothetical protein